ncbi:hypothetical protein SAMN05421774_102255 [Gemmobacter megaterium]|uniref:Uncharacterized protein n=2 Tax=Gemmobacter megaterium TaxID=1086013 RepID=A0A1N7LY40_9RHOB|nr:hypothetical protein GCM10011345_14820 [Gemmobacter megaterium]SIS78765.1 hypothetical protein SAMN05421774_102255 [Gemmobacter megaterium]
MIRTEPRAPFAFRRGICDLWRMNAPASQLRLTGARLLALFMVLAVAVLWQPRIAGRTAGAGPAEALLTTATLQGDKGQTPRAAVMVKRATEDRGPGAPPGLILAALRSIGPAWHPTPQGRVAAIAACPPDQPCARQAPRAPPLA